MTVMFYDSFEGDQSFANQTAWQEVPSKTGNLLPNGNFIQVYAEYGGSATNRGVEIRVLVDGAERAFDYHTPAVASQYHPFTVFGVLTPVSEGQHTISLQVRCAATPQTVLVRRIIRLMVFQV